MPDKDSTAYPFLARIHRFIQVDGVRTAEGCEGVTGAIIRACIRVGGRSPGGLQALLGAPMTVCDGPGGQDEDRGHGRNLTNYGFRRFPLCSHIYSHPSEVLDRLGMCVK